MGPRNVTRDKFREPILADLLTDLLETFDYGTPRTPGRAVIALGGLGTRVRVENRSAQLKMNVLSAKRPGPP